MIDDDRVVMAEAVVVVVEVILESWCYVVYRPCPRAPWTYWLHVSQLVVFN